VVHHFRVNLQVEMRFDARFHRSFITGLKYNVRFSIKRTSFVFMHEAVEVRDASSYSNTFLIITV
jgi:hypothetical protein